MTINKNSIFYGFVAMALTLFTVNAFATSINEIEVFTKNSTTIQHYQSFQYRHKSYRLSIHNLNAAEQWKQQFSENLSKDEDTALAQVNRKIQAMGGQVALRKTLTDVYSPLIRAIKIGLQEFPAVVINQQYVIYGTDNIQLAITKVKQWQHEND